MAQERIPVDPGCMLDESLLASVAGDAVFGRGVEYVRYLRGLRVMGSTATGTIQARNVYLVELDWTDDRLAGHCTCPHHADGHFCKHLVALGLSAIDRQQPATRAVAAADDDIDDVVASLPSDELRGLVADLARRDDRLRRELELRHAASSGDDHRLADELVGLVREALSVRGFIDYRRSFEVAADIERVLDELGRILDLGQPDAARPAALKALTRMRTVIGQADDSAGVLGDACQRAADLYARACREGSPDRTRLARWLARFRAESPGWPELVLADLVDAFDDAALQVYRSEVAKLDATHAGADHRYEVDAMLLELADHNGDLDRAIELLASGTPRDGAIVRRLWQAGRDADALVWLDQAAEAGRLSARGGANDYWLEPLEVATAYHEAGRVDDALGVLRGAFATQVRGRSVSWWTSSPRSSAATTCASGPWRRLASRPPRPHHRPPARAGSRPRDPRRPPGRVRRLPRGHPRRLPPPSVAHDSHRAGRPVATGMTSAAVRWWTATAVDDAARVALSTIILR